MQIYAIFELKGLKADDVIGEVLFWGTDRPVDKKLTARDVLESQTTGFDSRYRRKAIRSGGYHVGNAAHSKR
jgi:hypothetical protein